MVLCGINISATSEGLTFAATNGHYMALATIPGAFDQQIDLTVPSAFLTKVQKLLKDADTLAFSTKNNSLMTQLTTTLGRGNIVDISLYSRLLDGAFPDCARLIPPDFSRKVLFSREQLLQALGLIGSCDSESERTAYTCSFDVQPEQTRITKSGSSVLNVCQLTNSTIVQGDSITIGFNYDYLKKHLTALNSSEVSLKMNGEKSPVIVYGEDEDVPTTLRIMPVQLGY
jgi:DNA polymerase-3 subunit beta